MFAVQPAAHLLQELAQVQQVGEPPLAAVAFGRLPREQSRGHVEVMHQPAQHGQYPLPPPQIAITEKARHFRFPGKDIALQHIDFFP